MPYAPRVTSQPFRISISASITAHAFASLLPYIVALRKGIKPKELGLGRGEKAYVQCLDPEPPYTDGGTVIFEITVVRDEAEEGLEGR